MIANPNSTSQDAELFRKIIPVIRGVDGLNLLVKYTAFPGHAEEMCCGLRRSDYDAVIALGGDGTVNEMVNGLLGEPATDEQGLKRPAVQPEDLPALAVIPTGSANVFVRALGFPAHPEEAAHVLARILQRDLRRQIRLGTWNDRWFAVNAGFGIDADVLARVDRAREKGFAATPLRYFNIGIRAFFRTHKNPPRISVRAQTETGKTFSESQLPLLFASNTNPWTFFGPMPVVTNPRNSFDQGLGLFGITEISGLSGLAAMLYLVGLDSIGVINRMMGGTLVQFDDAQTVELDCDGPQRFQSDGESEGKREHVRLQSVPNALEVFAPKEPRPASERSFTEMLRDLLRL